MDFSQTMGRTLVLALACLWMAPVVGAQDGKSSEPGRSGEPAQGSAAKTAKPAGVEEIVVTARKREENLQATPVAISAFTETDLVDADVRRIQEITSSVPTLQFDGATGFANSARVYLRGVGNGDPISSDDPGVGIYVDGVFLPRAQGALLTVADVQQVEVLRGPQGTLFGKNTIGGAISITTKKPDASAFSGGAEVRIGNYKRFDTRLSVNVPLVVERATARFSIATATRDPFTKNKSTGRDFQDDKLLAARAQFMFLPSDASEFNLSLDRSREHRVQAGGKCVVSNTRPNFNGGANGTEQAGGADLDGDGIIENQAAAASFAAVNGVPLGMQQSAILGSLATSQNSNNFLNACARDAARDERSVASDLSSSKDFLDTYGIAGTFTYDLNDDMTFKSVSSWRRNLVEGRLDNDYTELNFAQASLDGGDGKQESFSQELQITGSGLDDRFQYVAGVYAFKEAIDENQFGGLSTLSPFIGAAALRIRDDSNNQNSSTSLFSAAIAGPLEATFDTVNAAFGAPGLTIGPGNAFVAVPGAITNTTRKIDNLGYAAYTQGTYDLTDELSLTAGLRLTSESKRVLSEIRAVTGGFVGSMVRVPGELDFGFDKTARFKDISPLLNLSYQASDDLLMYGTYSRGFKSGGFNGRANNVALLNNIADEKLISYEVGFKSSLLDNKVRLNGAAYWTLYQDIQLTIPRGINGQASIQVLNAGEAVIKGGELELLAQLLPELELTGSIGVINSRYTDFDDPGNAFAKDRRLLATPNYTGNVALAYTLPLASSGDLRLRSEWTYRGSSGTDVVDSRLLRKSKAGELDVSATWSMADGKTEIVGFANNLLNREYFTNGVNLGDSLGIAYRFYNDPRTYGLEIRRRF